MTTLKLAVTLFAASIVTVHVVDVPVHAPLQPPAVATVSAYVGITALKLAVTERAWLIVTVHVGAVPLHAPPPPHPPKVLFALGVAVSVTFVPIVRFAEHVLPQLMPPTLD